MSLLFQAHLLDVAAPIGRKVSPMLKHMQSKKLAYELVSDKKVIPLAELWVQDCDVKSVERCKG